MQTFEYSFVNAVSRNRSFGRILSRVLFIRVDHVLFDMRLSVLFYKIPICREGSPINPLTF